MSSVGNAINNTSVFNGTNLTNLWSGNELNGHMLRRSCLLQYVTEGKIEGRIEVTGRQ